MGKSRKREFVQARQISMYFLQNLAKVSINRIGRLIGNRDHSTVAHSIDKIVTQMQVDKNLMRNIKAIERNLKVGKK